MAEIAVSSVALPADEPWGGYLDRIIGNGEYFLAPENEKVVYNRAFSAALTLEGTGPGWSMYAPQARRLLGASGYALSADGGLSLHEASIPGGAYTAVSPDAALCAVGDYDGVGLGFYPLAGGFGYGLAVWSISFAALRAALGSPDSWSPQIVPAAGGGAVVVADRDGTKYAVVDVGAQAVLPGDFAEADGGETILERRFSPDTLTCVSVAAGSGGLRCYTRVAGGLFALSGTFAPPDNSAVLGVAMDGAHCAVVSFGGAYDAVVSYVNLATMSVVGSASLEAAADYGVGTVTAGTGSTFSFVARAADGVRVYTTSLSGETAVSAFWTAFVGTYETL